MACPAHSACHEPSQCTSSCASPSGHYSTCGNAPSQCRDLQCKPRSDPSKRGFDHRGLEIERPAGSECNDLLGVDRVALMFLSLGALPQDALWTAWLEGASGLLPLQPLQVTDPDSNPSLTLNSTHTLALAVTLF